MSNTLLPVQQPASLAPSVGTGRQSHISVLEPELVCSLPRRAHLTSGTRKTHRFLWNLFIGTFLILFFFARRDLEKWDALVNHGQVIQAWVTSKSPLPKKSSYQVDYGFYVKKAYYSGDMTVSAYDYYKIQVGDCLPITYLSGTKGIWELGKVTAKQRDRRLITWIVWTFTATGLMGTVLACSLMRAKKQLWLLQNGIATVATITRIEPTSSNTTSDLVYYGVTYHYRVPHRHKAGYRSLEDTIYVTCEMAKKYRRDGCLSVLYDAQDPSKSLAYSQITAAHLGAVTIY